MFVIHVDNHRIQFYGKYLTPEELAQYAKEAREIFAKPNFNVQMIFDLNNRYYNNQNNFHGGGQNYGKK